MNKIEEAKQRLDVALIERDIHAAQAKPTFYRRFVVGIQDLMTAFGGRTSTFTGCAIVSTAAMTLLYLYVSKPNSYVPLLIGCVGEASILLIWVSRNKLKSITGPGGVSVNMNDGDEVERLTLRKDNPNKQKPGRGHVDTSFNFDLEDQSMAEDSRAAMEKSS